MARLSDLVNTDLGSDVIMIQEVEIPVAFNFEAMEHIADFYSTDDVDADYSAFENEITWMTSQEDLPVNGKTMKIMRALVFGMVRAGGTECTPQELNGSIPFDQVPEIFKVCFDVFNRQNFQGKDLKKSVKPQDHKKSQKKTTKTPKAK